MSDAPSPSPPWSLSGSLSFAESVSHWCYHCNKRVVVETLTDFPDVICCECKNGFVESIQPIPAAYSATPPLSPDLVAEDSTFGSHFVQMLRLLAQAARDDHAPSQRSTPHVDASYEDDFFRLELNSWYENEERNVDEEDDEDADVDKIDDIGVDDGERSLDNQPREEENLSVNGSENDAERDYEHDEYDEEQDLRRRRQEMLPLRIREYPTRSRTGRNRILDWAEILMGIEDNSIEFRIEVPESDRYIGNPADYVDAAGYEALLQNLAEGDDGRRGAPPAAKSAIEALESFEIGSEAESVMCVVCKDAMVVGETVKKLPCGHGYHGSCIVPWLGTRNSCPICRFELQTDDAEYEGERKKRATFSDCGGSSSASGLM